jgi:hypothetical protein
MNILQKWLRISTIYVSRFYIGERKKARIILTTLQYDNPKCGLVAPDKKN